MFSVVTRRARRCSNPTKMPTMEPTKEPTSAGEGVTLDRGLR